jgi:hypothetical protein
VRVNATHWHARERTHVHARACLCPSELLFLRIRLRSGSDEPDSEAPRSRAALSGSLPESESSRLVLTCASAQVAPTVTVLSRRGDVTDVPEKVTPPPRSPSRLRIVSESPVNPSPDLP